MDEIQEELPETRRGRAERRKKDISKALRKRAMSRTTMGFEWYRNQGLHVYSKGKIHCSCPICSDKTRGKIVKKQGKSECWPISDRRKRESMTQKEKEPEDECYGSEISDGRRAD